MYPLVLPSELSSHPDLNCTSSPSRRDKKDDLMHALVALATFQANATMYTNTRTLISTQTHAYFHTCKHVAQTPAVKVFQWAAWATEYTTHTCLHTQMHTHPPMGKTEWGVLRVWFMMANTPTVDPLKGQWPYRGLLTSSERERSPLADSLELRLGNWSWEARLKSGAAQTRQSSRGIHNRCSKL